MATDMKLSSRINRIVRIAVFDRR